MTEPEQGGGTGKESTSTAKTQKSGAASVATITVWLLLRLARIECSREEVHASAYRHVTPHHPRLSKERLAPKDPSVREILDSYIAGLEAASNARSDQVGGKLRTLLATTGLVFALLGGLSLNGSGVFLLPAMALFVSAVVALRALGVGTSSALSLSDDDLGQSADQLRATAAQERMRAVNANECH